MLKLSQMVDLEQEWLRGRSSLGAAAKWNAEEIRLVSELGYSLAEQGRTDEAITLFEGLSALAPATAYFHSALGALWLRDSNPEKAIPYLNSAISIDSTDIYSLVNRGEAFMRMGITDSAVKDLKTALKMGAKNKDANHGQTTVERCLTRAKALLLTIEKFGIK